MSFYDVTSFTLKGDGNIRNLCLMSERGYLRYEDREVYSPNCKFSKEDATNDPQKGLHIRCLYNNKYLVRQASTDFIVATASEKNEVETSPDCTLFKYTVISIDSIKLIHVNTGRTVTIEKPEDPVNGYYLSVNPNAIPAESITIDVSRIIKLPKFVVFKGDNEKYLQQHHDLKYWADLQEFWGEDSFNKKTWYEIFPTSNGDVRLKSVALNQFMRRTLTMYIHLDSDVLPSGDPASVFGITKVNDTTIALRNRLHGEFCHRYEETSPASMGSTFRCRADSAIKESHLVVEEPVIDRTVKIEYRLQHARIYDTQPKSWVSAEVTNTTPETDSFSLETKYVESYSHTLHVTATVSTNITTKFSAGIPLVVESEVEVDIGASIETGYGHTWDKTTEHLASVSVVIPAGKKRAARMLSMNAKCDVPFSYVQTDILANNDRIETVLEDGVFTGLNGYHFVIEIFDPENNPSVALEKRNWKPLTLPDLVQGGSLRKKLAGGPGSD